MTIAKHRRTFSSCILPRRRHIELLRQFPKGLFDHVVAIGSWLLTLDNTFDHVIVVFQCLSIFCHEQEKKRKTASLRASVVVLLCQQVSPKLYALPPWLHRFCHVLVNSAHDSNPRCWADSKQRFNQNFNLVSIHMATNFYVEDWTDPRMLENPSFRSSLLFASWHCVFSAQILRPISFFCTKCEEVLSFFDNPQASVRA